MMEANEEVEEYIHHQPLRGRGGQRGQRGQRSSSRAQRDDCDDIGEIAKKIFTFIICFYYSFVAIE